MTHISLDKSKCRDCSFCAQVCPNLVFKLVDKKTMLHDENVKECILCGQCVAACPEDAIDVEGLDRAVFDPLEPSEVDADRFSVFSKNRRSVRTYKKKPVTREVVEQALEMGSYAPLSMPPWAVEVAVLLGRDKMQLLAEKIATTLEKMVEMNHHLISRLFMRHSIGKERYKFMDEFFIPLLEEGLEIFHEQHIDVILRDAPALMVFHCSPSALEGQVDSVLAAAHTAMALQSMGLGVCFNGLVPASTQMDKEILAELGIPAENTAHAAFTFGYPRIKYKKSVRRDFRSVTYA